MRLKAGLSGTPLAGEFWLMEAQGHKYDVSPYLVAGIAGTESTFGAASCGGNAWGIDSCVDDWSWFPTFGDGIRYTTRLLHDDYDLTSLVAVGDRYAACGSCWADATAGHMGRFGADGTWLRYPG